MVRVLSAARVAPWPDGRTRLRQRVAALAVAATTLVAGCVTGRPPAGDVYQRGAVAADHHLASQAGLEMLRRGGNAVDAAVAASFTLSVVRPYSCGIGGGGFMLVHRPDEAPVAIDYRETAAAAVGPDYYVDLRERTGRDDLSRYGPHAAGVPGTVAGLLWALEEHGTLDRATVLGPAIRVAEEGFPADASWAGAARSLAEAVAERPWLAEAAGFLWTDLCREGELRAGDHIRNLPQSRALRLIAEHGVDGFYAGPVGRAIVAAMARAPAIGTGPIVAEDLRGYEPRIMTPLRGRFRHWSILSMPPPSSGGVAMQQIFGMLERRLPDVTTGAAVGDLAALRGPDYVHLLTESMKHAFADRAQWLADPDYADVPIDRLLDPAYLNELAARIDLSGTRDRLAYGSVEPVAEGGGTSHLSVVDDRGMAVACTETINLHFGSGVCVPGYGFALNDEMDDFTTIPGAANAFGLRQSDMNLPEPGKRPLSSMSPTIVVEDGRAVLIAGASGGPRIITGTTQCLLNCMLADATPHASVAAPRVHHQWLPDVLRFEQRWSDESTIAAMRARGHEVASIDGVGVVQLIRITPDGIRAASDPRKGGRPAGW